MQKLISAATDTHYNLIIREEKFDEGDCIFVPYGPSDRRKQKLYGVRVESVDQLIGAFSTNECNYLRGKGGSL